MGAEPTGIVSAVFGPADRKAVLNHCIRRELVQYQCATALGISVHPYIDLSAAIDPVMSIGPGRPIDGQLNAV